MNAREVGHERGSKIFSRRFLKTSKYVFRCMKLATILGGNPIAGYRNIVESIATGALGGIFFEELSPWQK
jgi:hypothetical protein